MPWFRVDDTLAFHHKSIACGNAALGLWVRAGAWSMQMLTDGQVPRAVARQMGTAREAARLVDAGLWDETGDGYVFHDWTGCQPPAEKLRQERRASAERLARWREKRRAERDV